MPHIGGVFITGTDTGVGKTAVAAAVAAAISASGRSVHAYKPVVTGTEELGLEWPLDHELLATITEQSPAEVAPISFAPPVSPHLAARLAHRTLGPQELVEAGRAIIASCDFAVVEGVGGLLVPLTDDYLIRDLAVELALPLLIVARPGLGTINHTLLTVEAARNAGLEVAAIVLNPWPQTASVMESSNLETVEALSSVPTYRMAAVPSPTAENLCAALPADLLSVFF